MIDINKYISTFIIRIALPATSAFTEKYAFSMAISRIRMPNTKYNAKINHLSAVLMI